MRDANGRNPNSLRLSEARELTPPVSAIKAMQQSLQLALFGAIGEPDMLAIASKLKEQALAGDLRAMKLLLSLIVPAAPSGRPVQVNQGVVLRGEWGGESPPTPPGRKATLPATLPAPTTIPAGHPDKVLLMQQRLAAGQALTNPNDAPPDPDSINHMAGPRAALREEED